MNLDSLGGRWLEADYSLVRLGRMVRDCCLVNNFSQMVNQVTRVQFNKVKMQTTTSCIDNVYCNTEQRISAVKIITQVIMMQYYTQDFPKIQYHQQEPLEKEVITLSMKNTM